jgi:hypothetical protein
MRVILAHIESPTTNPSTRHNPHAKNMTRGKKPDAAIREAKKFAERMGYRWQENTENPELAYDFMAFKPGYAMLVKVRVPRYHINPDTFYEDLLEDDLREVRALPVPEMDAPRDLAPHPARAGLAPAPGPRARCGGDRMVGAGRV